MNRLKQRLTKWYAESKLEIKDDNNRPRLLMWANSDERAWYMGRRPMVHLAALVGAVPLVLAAVLAQPGWRSDQSVWWAWILAGIGAAIWVYSLFPFAAARLAFRDRRKKAALFRVESAHQALVADRDLELYRLFDVTRRQLDAYQELTRRQQRAAFVAALASSVAGLIVLIAGILLSLRVSPGSGEYVVAGLTGIGTLLSAFITGTFYALSRQANRQLNRYYEEPRTTGQLILAERLAQTYTGGAKEEVDHIIDEALHLARDLGPRGRDRRTRATTSNGVGAPTR
jgi:uncharacterized membrane protein YdcZ (DUF606 family)